MSVKIAIYKIVKSQAFQKSTKKKKLLSACRNLLDLLASSIPLENLTENIRSLKANLFYQEFTLDADPQFLKVFVNKIDDTVIVERLLNSNIDYSESEKKY